MSISARTNTQISWVATVATVAVALSAGVLSWHGLTQLGIGAGLGDLSVLLPVVIDGGMLVGALHVLHAGLSGRSTAWGWLMTWTGIVVSVWGNVAGAANLTFASAVVHAMPALTLAATIEATMQIIKHRAMTSQPDRSISADRDSSRDVGVLVADVEVDLSENLTPPALPAPVETPDIGAASQSEPVKTDPNLPIITTGGQVETITRDAPFVPKLVMADSSFTDPKTLAFGVWMYGEDQEGRIPTPKRAVEMGISTSESSARRLRKKVEDIGIDKFAAHYRPLNKSTRGA